MADTPTPEPTPRPQPLALAQIAQLVVVVAGFAGWQVAESTVLRVIIGINAVILAVGPYVYAHRRVTPISDPVDATGTPLVPVDTVPVGAPVDPLLVQVLEQLKPPANGADVTDRFNDAEVAAIAEPAPAPVADVPPWTMPKPAIGLVGEPVVGGRDGHQAVDNPT